MNDAKQPTLHFPQRPATGRFTGRQQLRLKVARQILGGRLREWLLFDARAVGVVTAWLGIAVSIGLRLSGRTYRAFNLLTAIHRLGHSARANAAIERMLPRSDGAAKGPVGVRLPALVHQEHVARVVNTEAFRALARDPTKLLGTRALVLKSPSEGERGVLVLDYIYVFPLFARLFDLARIRERYHLVLEPSWVGACNGDILLYTRHRSPVFVETTEPQEQAFIRRLSSNLIPVTTAANWWVDHRLIRPLADVPKDVDVIMVAGWSGFKRHASFFSALHRLKRAGRALKVVLVGYPVAQDMTRQDVVDCARYYDVADRLEVHESLSFEEVNYQLNRAKVKVLWSRKEGYNRAIIEAMLADVPCILREGHNYGHHYPYINDRTGRYANEENLPSQILTVINSSDRFSPRRWVLDHMSCQIATRVLSDAIRKTALEAGERWTRDLAVKTVRVDRQMYWNSDDSERFRPDYDFILSTRQGGM